jgi:transcription elongation GreA/GreB family factor
MLWLLSSCNSDLTSPLEDEAFPMSKAFTREDDTGREADLPERVISPHTNLVTAEGLAQIEATIARLTKEQGRAREVGDVTAAANAARDLRYWIARRATAQLTEPTPGSQVHFGSRVTIKRPDGSTRTYRIVGSDEGDPARGTLSYASPLAQAMMGKEIGDTVVVGAREEEIVRVT